MKNDTLLKNAILSLMPFVWQLFFFCFPVFVVVMLAFVFRSASGWQVTLQHLIWVCNVRTFTIIGNSVRLAFINSVLSMVIAYPLVYYLVFFAKRWKHTFLLLLLFPFWINLLLQVYSWIFILKNGGVLSNLVTSFSRTGACIRLAHSSFGVSLVMLYCYIPLMIIPLYGALEQCEKQVIEASLDLGASSWRTFYSIILPLSLSGIQTGFFLVFIPSFAEYVIPLLLGGGRQLYVTTLISHYFLVVRDFHKGAAVMVLGAAVLMICIIVLRVIFNLLKGVFL